MDFEQFTQKAAAGVQEFVGAAGTVSLNRVRKNNGVELTGLVISEPDKNISPSIYLEEFYEAFCGGEEFSSLVYEMVKIYEKNRLSCSVSLDFFLDYEKVRKKIMYKLINYSKNRELLQEIPHLPFLDLAVVFYYDLKDGIFGHASILIRNSHAQKWQVDAPALYEQAAENTAFHYPYEMKTMEELMKEMFASSLRQELKRAVSRQLERETSIVIEESWLQDMAVQMMGQVKDKEGVFPMYVLSNSSHVNGACCILYPDLLRNVSGQIHENLYILPSSIHEIIMVPACFTQKPSELKEMVEEINAAELEAEEVLSDSVYFYDREADKLSLCN